METQTEKLVMSESVKELAAALNKFQGDVKTVAKDAENPYFKSKYASLEAIIEAIRDPLSKNGLSYSQFPIGKNKLVTILLHNSGEYLSSTVEMTPKDTSPQAHGSVITYMRRYSISAILGLATEEDDDGNGATVQKSVVKNEKVGGDDLYAKTVLAIEKAKSVEALNVLGQKIASSKKLTDTQKDKLDSLIGLGITALSDNN